MSMSFFTMIPKVAHSALYKIAAIEKRIADENITNTQLLEEVAQLIKLKSLHYESQCYTGFASDLQRLSNAMFNEGLVDDAVAALLGCEKSLQSVLSNGHSSAAEQKCLVLELADCVLMRLQMSDSHQEQSLKSSLDSCQNVMKTLAKVGESKSEHTAIALLTQAEILYRLGEIESTAKSLEEALELLSWLISQSQQNNNDPTTRRNLLMRKAGCLETFGNLHFDRRNTFHAEKFLAAAMDIWHEEIFRNQAKELRNHPLYFRCLNSVGTFYGQCGWTAKAVEILEQARKLQQSAQSDPEGLAWLLLSLAKAYYSREDFVGSLRLTEEAEEILRRIIGDVQGPSRYRTSLAQIIEHKSSLLTMQGRHSESVAIVEEAIAMYNVNETNLEPIYCRLLFARAMQHLQAQEYDRAIDLALISQEIVQKTRGEQDNQIADALRVIGIAQCEKSINFNNYTSSSTSSVSPSPHSIDDTLFLKGISNLERALAIFENSPDDVNALEEENQLPTRLPDVQAILLDIANLYEAKKDFKKAIARLENMRCVRMQLLEQNGKANNDDQVIVDTEAKIAALYDKVQPERKRRQ